MGENHKHHEVEEPISENEAGALHSHHLMDKPDQPVAEPQHDHLSHSMTSEEHAQTHHHEEGSQNVSAVQAAGQVMHTPQSGVDEHTGHGAAHADHTGHEQMFRRKILGFTDAVDPGPAVQQRLANDAGYSACRLSPAAQWLAPMFSV